MFILNLNLKFRQCRLLLKKRVTGLVIIKKIISRIKNEQHYIEHNFSSIIFFY